jgi:hypothetical protein
MAVVSDMTNALTNYLAGELKREQELGFHAVNAQTGTPERDATESEIEQYLAVNATRKPWKRGPVLVGEVLIETNYRNHPNHGKPVDQGNWAWL